MNDTKMPWVKLYTDMLDDPKIGRLPDVLKWRFTQLILLAGECDAEGYLANGQEPMSTEDIAWRLRLEAGHLAQELEILSTTGAIKSEQDEDGTTWWIVVNFAKRQGRTQAEKRANWRERQQRHRAKKREEESDPPDSDQQEEPDDSHAGVTGDTNGSHTREKRREEERRGETASRDADASPPPQQSPRLLLRQELQGYFVSVTGLPPPKAKTKADMRAAQKLWWGPLDYIGNDLAGGRCEAAKELIRMSVLRLKDVTVASPNSILNTAKAVYAENNRSIPNNGYTPA